MLDTTREQLEREFAVIEASFRIEGQDPSGDAIYEEAKARVLSGEMSVEQALEFALAETAKTARPLNAIAS